MKRKQALEIASNLLEQFEPFCQRVAIAGSIRRGKPEVKDIEIVAMPHLTEVRDMFNNSTGHISMLDDFNFSSIGNVLKNGPRFKQIELPEGITLDLFIVMPPAEWGSIFAIRTGPDDFNVWLMTPRRKGGAMPGFLKQRDGVLWHGKEVISTPEEDDYFNALGLPYIEPSERQPRWNINPVHTPA